ncbi:hypothetical protein ECZU26_52970 [Escherichia coli]|nr:hypothetical protein ECZU26_52970 [Escherichia coli]
MTTRQHSSFAIVFILGLLAMLMPLSIDMYLPALPVISAQFGVPAGSTQMTLSTYILGFALGQLIYGPMATASGVSRWFLAVRWCLPPPRWRVRWQTPSIS